jgi:hypothetical protein
MKQALLVGAMVIAAAGCRTRPWEIAVESDGGPPDMAQEDLSQVCAQHRLLPRPVTEMRQLNPGQFDPGQQALGSVMRVLLGVPLRPCESVGDVQVRLTPGNATDFATVQVNVWQASFDCGPPETVYRVAYLGSDLPLSNLRLVIGDGAPGGTARLDVTVSPRPMADCSTAVPMNGTCQLDCQCEKADPRSRCVLDNPRSGRCGIPCEEDADCDVAQGFHCDTNFDWTCRAGAPPPTMDVCAFGQGCGTTQCRDVAASSVCRMGSAPSCTCDCDCPAGSLCTLAGTCVTPCTTDANCANGCGCGDGFCTSR